jgi:hypothetical protein
MPKHDLPDGNEDATNLIDFREHLRRRLTQTPHNDDGDPKSEASDWEVYRHAEYGDGKRLGFSRYDLPWLGLLLIIGWIIWISIRR